MHPRGQWNGDTCSNHICGIGMSAPIMDKIGNLSLSELYQVFKMCCCYSTCTSTNLIRRWNGGLPRKTCNFPSVRTVAQLYHPLTGQHIDKGLVRRLQGSNSQSLRD